MARPESIGGSSIPTIDPSVAAVELDGEAVLYHERRNTVHVLNATATVIWNCLDGAVDLETLSNEVAEVFSADLDLVRSDVIGAVREFGRQGLLEGIEPDPEAVEARTLVQPHVSEALDD